MRCGVLLAVIAVAALSVLASGIHVFSDDQPVLVKELASKVNSKAGGTWVASHDNGRRLRGITMAGAKRLMGAAQLDNSALPRRVFSTAEMAVNLPKTFDSASHWPQCSTIREIRDQSDCGSCWAIAAAGAISDRYCVGANITNLRISTANLLSCCFACGFGCKGGWPIMAWNWWVYMGLTTESCQPYPFPSCSHHSTSDDRPACPAEPYETPSCNATCADKEKPLQMYYGSSAFSLTSEDAYMRELYLNGPFEIAFTVYEDFLTYKSGVYSHQAGTQLGGHAVRLVGWGEENGIPYWKVANSWNDDWGNEGYFRILRGKDECGIESSGVAGLPKVPS